MADARRGADPERAAEHVAARLAGADPAAVRSLLAAWWGWAGALAARGGVMDSDRFLDQREAEGLLELPRPVAARAIELELAYLHGVGAARRAPAPTRGAAAVGRVGARAPAARRAPVSSTLVGSLAFGALAVLVIGGIALGQLVPHVPLPAAGDHAATAPYRAWIGVLAGALGVLATVLVTRRRPETAAALRVPALGLAALGLFGFGLLAGAAWLEWSAGVLFVVAGVAAWLGQR